MSDEKDAKLAAALRQAKQGPMFFAFVAKGSTEGVLIVAKKTIAVKEINEAKAESGGKKVFRGRCLGEDGKLIFEMAEEPPSTLAKQLKAVIQTSAGMMLQVETRSAPDLQEADETPAEQTPPAAPPAPPQPPQDPAARFAAMLKSLAPVIQMVDGIKNAQAKEARQAVSEANTLFRSQQYGAAIETLEIAKGLLKEALVAAKSAQTPASAVPSPVPPTAPPVPPANAGATRFAARLKALAPVMQRADATGSPQAQDAKRQIGAANKLYVAKQFDEANAALDQAEVFIKQAFAAQQPAKDGKSSFVRLQQCRLDWGGALQKIQTDLDRLEQATRQAYQADERLAVIQAAITNVAATLRTQHAALTDKLDEALNAQEPAQRQQYHDEARVLIGQMATYADSDPLLQSIDQNGLVPLAIQSTLSSVLPALASQLSA